MNSPVSRRRFLQHSSLSVAGLFFVSRHPWVRGASPNEKLNIGVIGVANRGRDDLNGVSAENIVALCDIDDTYLASAAQRFPRAATYNDFRRMIERNDLDAVVIGVPDHIHAAATSAALRTGRHVYCEKPLTRTVSEARFVTDLAIRNRRVTQMGTQIHAGENYRRVVELVKSNAIGPIREVHNWVGTTWTGPGERPADEPPVPPNIHWDLWLGPAPKRPYNPIYLPARWRGWWDFGGGGMSDMACHHMDLPFWALDLRYPLTVEAEGPPVNAENAPAWRIVRYTFPPRGAQPGVHLTWYNGGKQPPQIEDGTIPKWGAGTLFIGEKGMLLADYNKLLLLPEKEFEGFEAPRPFIPPSIGHHREWVEACKTGGVTTCNFDYSGPLAETVLLGNVAYRSGRKIEWNSRTLTAVGCPEADPYIQHLYRTGWSL